MVKASDQAVRITSEEMAAALAILVKNFPSISEPDQRDIIITASCSNHNYMRSIYKKLEATDAALPIVVAESEYNQLGWSNLELDTGADFFNATLELDKPGARTTLGTVIDSDDKPSGLTDPAIYVPSDDSRGDKLQLSASEVGNEFSTA